MNLRGRVWGSKIGHFGRAVLECEVDVRSTYTIVVATVSTAFWRDGIWIWRQEVPWFRRDFKIKTKSHHFLSCTVFFLWKSRKLWGRTTYLRKGQVRPKWQLLLRMCTSIFGESRLWGVSKPWRLNSFNPKSIATLVSVFNPFLMGALLLLKVLIPFLMVALFVTVTRKYNR